MRQTEREASTAVLLLPPENHRATVTDALAGVRVEVTAATATVDAVLVLVEEHNPDVLVVDVDVPEGRCAALDAIASAVAARPSLTVLVLADRADAAVVESAFAAGASAFVLKTGTTAPAVARALATTPLRSTRRSLACERSSSSPAAPRLTRRELEILRLVSEGRSNRAVGRLLWVSDQTVKFHLANIYRKLGVGSRFEAAQAAREHGLLDPPRDDDLAAALEAIVSPTAEGTSP
jgi:two-component system response regulator DevR